MWGGGIVKVSEREWLPWPIDLLMIHYRRRVQKQQEEEERKKREAEERIREAEEEKAMQIHTTSASGRGLTCVGGRTVALV